MRKRFGLRHGRQQWTKIGRGLRLVVGGGRLPGFPRLKVGDISLNLAARTKPDVQGDIARAPFADKVFSEVFFEFVDHDAFTGGNLGAIAESARMLRPGGRLLIHTGRAVNGAEVMEAMRSNGFKYIRVVHKGYVRISGRLAGR